MPLLHTKEYINEEGKKVIFREFGRIDDEGNEIITATIEEVLDSDEIQSQPEPEPEYSYNEVVENQLIIMEAIADQYERQEEINLINMEAQATIYEEILAMQGNTEEV